MMPLMLNHECGPRAERRSRPDCQSRFERVKHRLAALIFVAALSTAASAQNTSYPANFDPFPYVFTRVNGEYSLSIGAYTY